jgi:hypothetical protein
MKKYPPSDEYRGSDLEKRDLAEAAEAELYRDKKLIRTAKIIGGFTLVVIVGGVVHGALTDTVHYENGLDCSGTTEIPTKTGESLDSVADRDATRLGLDSSSASKLLTVYQKESSPFAYTYDDKSKTFIATGYANITSADTCSD